MSYDRELVATSNGEIIAPMDNGADTVITETSRAFYEFLDKYHVGDTYTYRNQLNEKGSRGIKDIDINLDDLISYDSAAFDTFKQKPAEFIQPFENVAKEVCSKFMSSEKIPEFHLLYSTSQNYVPIREISSEHVNKLVRVPGIVISASRSRSYIRELHYQCSRCKTAGQVITLDPMKKVSLPRHCANPDQSGENKCPMDSNYIVADLCKYVDQQTLKLQECPEDVPTGEMPRHIVCIVERSLVDKVSPGTRCSIVGYVDTFDQAKMKGVDTVAIKVSYIRVLGIQVEESGIGRAISTFSAADEEVFQQIAHSPNVYELLVRNIAPSLSGEYTEDIKKALCCLLFGGSRKILPDHTRLRGDINVLLMGDPSTAKSQFLKFIEKVAPVGVYTSGKGSSAAGLTASVIQGASGEFYLEGGAMVLADGGVVCIDEFDKMRETDRVAIHEAMEQQTISIAKAGITTVLNSRCSVLAAANPIYGRYDDTKTTSENIDFLPSILSRFDLIFIVRDIRDYDRDITMAKNVVDIHMRSNRGGEANVEEIPLDMMKKYVAYCRAKCAPRLSEEAGELLKNQYVAMRDEIHGKTLQDGEVPPVPISVRQLEAIVRIAESLAKMRLAHEATVDDVSEALRLFKLSTLSAAKSGIVMSEALPPEIKRQVDGVENMIKARVAIGSQISRSRVVNSLRSTGYSLFVIEKSLSALIRRKEFDEKSQGRVLLRLR